VRRDQKRIGRRFQGDFEQVARIQAEDGPAVGFDVPDAGQARGDARGGLEIGRIEQVVHLAHPIAALVDAADLDRQEEAHRGAGRRMHALVDRGGQVVASSTSVRWDVQTRITGRRIPRARDIRSADFAGCRRCP
jgi:hypothetical protein